MKSKYLHICIFAYISIKLVDIFVITDKNMDMMRATYIWKFLHEKPLKNHIISHDFRLKSKFFPKIRQKFAYSGF